MDVFRKFRLPIILSIAAAITALIALSIVGYYNWRYAILLEGVIAIAIVSAIVTFGMSCLGLHLARTHQYSPFIMAVTGSFFGLSAYFLIALITMISLVKPAYYERVIGFILLNGFVLGGFLAPIIGAVVGYRLVSKPRP